MAMYKPGGGDDGVLVGILQDFETALQTTSAGTGYAPIPLHSFRHADGTVITDTATEDPYMVTNDARNVLIWDKSDHAAILADVQVPGDFNATGDTISLELLMLNEGTTDTPVIAISAYRLAIAGGVSGGADMNPTDPTKGKGDTADTPELLSVSLAGNSIAAGDIIHVVIDPADHTTDAIELWGACLKYTKSALGSDATNHTLSGGVA